MWNSRGHATKAVNEYVINVLNAVFNLPIFMNLSEINIYRYQTARGIIDSIFGPKAHKNFPRRRRMKGKGCDGKGLYPSELDNDDPEYVHKGVDISAEKGDMVGKV